MSARGCSCRRRSWLNVGSFKWPKASTNNESSTDVGGNCFRRFRGGCLRDPDCLLSAIALTASERTSWLGAPLTNIAMAEYGDRDCCSHCSGCALACVFVGRW
eukprot:8930369-Alexandrium_andersonii.AAC.1